MPSEMVFQQPVKAAFVTRLQPFRLPGRAARQLPDQSTTLWVESSSTGDPRLRGALPIGDIQQTKCDGVKELDIRNRGKRVWTQIGWGRSHLIGQPHSLQSACPLGGIL